MDDRKLKLIRLLSNKYVWKMLERIRRSPARFGEMGDICQSERLRSIRLSGLESARWIERIASKSNGRIISQYKITSKGRNLMDLLEGAI